LGLAKDLSSYDHTEDKQSEIGILERLDLSLEDADDSQEVKLMADF
jgi:hypothetical protein